MSFSHIKLFRDIAQTKSLTRAAALNGVTASAASQHLQELEKTLETALLDRSTRPMTLTLAGRLYHDLCRDILRRNDEFTTALGSLRTQIDGTVRVASIYSVGLSEMSQLEGEFARRYPQAFLQVEYLRPEKVYEAVLDDSADIGLVSYPEPRKEVAALPWRQEEMVVALGPDHPMAGYRVIRPADLKGVDFVAFDEELPIRREVDRYLREHECEVRIVMHFDNIQMIKEAVALGSGLSIVPARVMGIELEQGRLRAVRLVSPGLYRPLGIIHRKKKRFPRAAQGFLALLQESIPGQPAGVRV